MTSIQPHQLQALISKVNYLEARIATLEQGYSAVASTVSTAQQEEFWRRDVVAKPANFEKWQPTMLHKRTGFVVRHLPNDAGVKSPKAILITPDNIGDVTLAQNEWQQRNPELYESYKQGPKAKVIIPSTDN